MTDLLIAFRRTTACLAIAVAMMIFSQPASAIVPEIVVDPRTGKAVPHYDLEQALVELTGNPVQVADMRWQRAPWFASSAGRPEHSHAETIRVSARGGI